jgi:orotidine-5'-phosphate decarboxylase
LKYKLRMADYSNKTISPFVATLEQHWQAGHFVCVGLDPEWSRLPAVIKESRTPEEALYAFGVEIMNATHDLVCAYKPNIAFYEALGDEGLRALTRTIAYSKTHYPDIPVILDAKRADIGSTNQGYVSAAFEHMQADAITVHPYLGKEALAPFLQRKDKGIIVLAKTSNPGSGELQDLPVGTDGEPLYLVVARNVAQQWNEYGNCALVVGATYPQELKRVREVVGDIPLLIPGIGAQGGDVAATVTAARDSHGGGMIINSSRAILYASSTADFAQAARKAVEKLNDEIQRYL